MRAWFSSWCIIRCCILWEEPHARNVKNDLLYLSCLLCFVFLTVSVACDLRFPRLSGCICFGRTAMGIIPSFSVPIIPSGGFERSRMSASNTAHSLNEKIVLSFPMNLSTRGFFLHEFSPFSFLRLVRLDSLPQWREPRFGRRVLRADRYAERTRKGPKPCFVQRKIASLLPATRSLWHALPS